MISIFGGLLRFLLISKYGPWADERITIGIANGLLIDEPIEKLVFTHQDIIAQNTPGNVLRATISDNGNSIFYNFSLHYWIKIWGNLDISARALSALLSLSLVFIGYAFAGKIFKSDFFSIIVALFFSIHPLFIQDAHEVRSYSMATFLSFISSYILYLIISGESKFIYLYFLYIITATLSLLSHYLTGYVFVAHFLVFIYTIRDRRSWFKYLISCGIICSCFLFWLIIGGMSGLNTLSKQFSGWETQISDLNPYLLPVSFKNIVAGWVQVFLQIFGNSIQDFGLRLREIWFLLVIPFAILGIAFFNLREPSDKKKFVVLFILTFTQIGFATITALKQGHCRPFLVAYAVFASPYALLILAYSLYIIKKLNKKVFIGLFLVVSIFMITSTLPTFFDNHGNSTPRPRNPYFLKAQSICNSIQKNDTIKFHNFRTAKLINIYLPKNIEIIQTIDSISGIKIEDYR